MKFVILSDIHANYAALQAVLERLDWMSRSTGDGFHIRFLGDLLGYGPMQDALECINWLRFAPRAEWVPGNHDEWILKPDGGVRPEARVTLLAQRLLLQRPENQNAWEWFVENVTPVISGEKPSVRQDVIGNLTLGFSHASIMPSQERNSYLFPWQYPLLTRDSREFKQRIQTESSIVFLGHTHFPMLGQLVNDEVKFQSIKYGQPIHLEEGSFVGNPGSVGQPRDGDTRASFAICDAESHSITFYRVDYNYRQTCEKLRQEQDIKYRKHLLILDERKDLVRQLGLEWQDGATMEKISATYQKLMNYLETGDGGENTANFSRIYRHPQWDLEA